MSAKPTSWDDFFALANQNDIPADFLAERDTAPAEERISITHDKALSRVPNQVLRVGDWLNN
jgi:hypothetical protein